ncbi:MAG TPA: hypothetical protein VNM14_19755 [Planctomycetota bacterium]|jgi:hypothetical protein|nr:hypothetical protein [Planctomycetota bacterium]
MDEPGRPEAATGSGGLVARLQAGLSWFNRQSENTRIGILVGASILGPIGLIALYSFLSDHLVAILVVFASMGLLSSLGGAIFYLRLRRQAAAAEAPPIAEKEIDFRDPTPPPAPAATYVPAVPSRPARVSPFNRSFTWAALVTMLLYLFLCWPVGVIANLMWLSEAEGIYRKTGSSPPGRGCLKLLGLVFILVPFVLIVVAVLVVYLHGQGVPMVPPKG